MLSCASANFAGAPALSMTIVVVGAVAGSWLILSLNRWWTTEASWLDRTARVLGACWIGLAAFQVLALYLRT